MTEVRPPAVAGAFYPGDASRLAAEVDRMLAGAQSSGGPAPKALVVPHAGYIYSGPIAASAYARLRASAPRVRRVVLLGPAHFVPLRGLALPEAQALATPLGQIPVDEAGARLAAKFPAVSESRLAHLREHSLEVQLPFLQRVLGDFTLVPLVVGHVDAQTTADIIDALWGGDETLVLVSSDLSHYLPYDMAREVDQTTAQRILALDAEGIEGDQACGAYPLRGLLLAARRRGLAVRQLDLRNSGDTAGDKDQVVGYGAFAFYPQEGRS